MTARPARLSVAPSTLYGTIRLVTAIHDDVPEWLELLRLHRHLNGQPSSRAIAKFPGVRLAHTRISHFFSGRATPKRETLECIARGLKDDEQVGRIMQAFDHARGYSPLPPSAAPSLDPSPEHPNLVLARAIHDLAAAIREHDRRND